MSKLLIIKSNIQHIITFILYNKIIETNYPMFQKFKLLYASANCLVFILFHNFNFIC